MAGIIRPYAALISAASSRPSRGESVLVQSARLPMKKCSAAQEKPAVAGACRDDAEAQVAYQHEQRAKRAELAVAPVILQFKSDVHILPQADHIFAG